MNDAGRQQQADDTASKSPPTLEQQDTSAAATPIRPTKPAAPRIANPYLKPKPPVAFHLSRSTSFGPTSVAAPAAANSDQQDSTSDEASSTADDHANGSSNNNNRSALMTEIRKKSVGPIDRATWERLPSRNVSYQPAEVLTVSELQQHGPQHYTDRSVRVTGVVLHRHVLGDDGKHVVFIVGDPLLAINVGGGSTTTAAARSRQKPVGGARQTPNTSVASRSSFQTPGHRTSLLRRATPGTTLGSRKTPFKTPRLVSRKRPLGGAPAARVTLSPLDIMSACLSEHDVSIVALCRSSQVNGLKDCKVGDLAMVMGEVRRQPQHSQESLGASSHCSADHSLPPLIESLLRRNAGVRIFIEVRVLRNVNGTDMRLHQEALKMRRQHLLQTQIGAIGESEDMIRPGCGPPPYSGNAFEKNLRND